MGIGWSGLFWLLSNTPPLHWDSPAVEAISLGVIALTYGPPLLVIKVFTGRVRRRRGQRLDPSADV
jgi:hypothetical protein